MNSSSLKIILDESQLNSHVDNLIVEQERLDELVGTALALGAGALAAKSLGRKFKNAGGFESLKSSLKKWWHGPHKAKLLNFKKKYPNFKKPDEPIPNFVAGLKYLKSIHNDIIADESLSEERKDQMIDSLRKLLISLVPQLTESVVLETAALATKEGQAAVKNYKKTKRLSRRAAAELLLNRMTDSSEGATVLNLPAEVEDAEGSTDETGAEGKDVGDLASQVVDDVRAAGSKEDKKRELEDGIKELMKKTGESREKILSYLQDVMKKESSKKEDSSEEGKTSGEPGGLAKPSKRIEDVAKRSKVPSEKVKVILSALAKKGFIKAEGRKILISRKMANLLEAVSASGGVTAHRIVPIGPDTSSTSTASSAKPDDKDQGNSDKSPESPDKTQTPSTKDTKSASSAPSDQDPNQSPESSGGSTRAQSGAPKAQPSDKAKAFNHVWKSVEQELTPGGINRNDFWKVMNALGKRIETKALVAMKQAAGSTNEGVVTVERWQRIAGIL